MYITNKLYIPILKMCKKWKNYKYYFKNKEKIVILRYFKNFSLKK